MDPIATLVMLAGTTGTISTPTSGGSRNYDPTASSDFTPGAPVTATVRGEYRRIHETQQDGRKKALYTLSAKTRPANVTANLSKITIKGTVWDIVDVRERIWRDMVTGYTLDLRL